MPRWSRWSSQNSEITEFAATYATKPVFLIDSNVDGITILLDGEPRRIPWAFPADTHSDGIWAEAPAKRSRGARLRRRPVSLQELERRREAAPTGSACPPSGGRVSLEVAREFRLRVASRNRPDDAGIVISPPSEDGFYAEGTRVQVTANPGSGRRFSGWIGEVSGSEPAQTIVMDGAKWLEAVFTKSEPVRPGESRRVTLRASDRFQLYSGSEGYNVLVPPDAAELTVRFQSSSAEEVDLRVHRAGSVRLEPGRLRRNAHGRRRFRVDFYGSRRDGHDHTRISSASGQRHLLHRPRRSSSGGRRSRERFRQRSGAAGLSRPGLRHSHSCLQPGQTQARRRVRLAHRDDRHGPVQGRFERKLAHGQPARNGPVRETARKRSPSRRTQPAWHTALMGAR